MGTPRTKLGLGALFVALAADMLDAPQTVPWGLLAAGCFFVFWGVWPKAVLGTIQRLPKGTLLAEKLNLFGAWLDGVAALPFDPEVAKELERMHTLGEDILNRCPYLMTGDPNYSDRRQEWDAEVNEWTESVEGYIAENLNRSESYMFRTHSRTRPRELKGEMTGKINKLRLVTGRYLLRDDGTREIS